MDPDSASRARIQYPRKILLVADQSVRVSIDDGPSFRPCFSQTFVGRGCAELIAMRHHQRSARKRDFGGHRQTVSMGIPAPDIVVACHSHNPSLPHQLPKSL